MDSFHLRSNKAINMPYHICIGYDTRSIKGFKDKDMVYTLEMIFAKNSKASKQ